MKPTQKFGAYIGRFNPIHLGHCRVIEEMLKNHGSENSLLVIGSCTAQTSLRHFFSYDERRRLIKAVYPDIRIVGLPDYHDDASWLAALDDILSAAGMKPEEVVFYGGCQEDVRFFFDDNRNCHILNRFDGTSVSTSATEVRDALLFERPIDKLVHPNIVGDLKSLFKEKWEKFKKL